MYTQGEKIVPVYLEEEMKDSYINYAMSVIVGRALPDARDGLKPVHRRILYAMNELALQHNKPYKKCARITGEVLGKYHPHGDVAVYDSLVRMVQDFSLRYPLVDGQGNFGCFTKDTKIRLTDGRCLNFGELIKEAAEGKKNYTFAFNSEKRKIEIAEIKNPRKTRRSAEIIKVILDSGEEIKCTPDHPFMLTDGSYKKAKDLKTQDSLMPLYTQLYDGNGDPNLKGYEVVWQPMENKWEFAQMLCHCEERQRRSNLKSAIASRLLRLPPKAASLAVARNDGEALPKTEPPLLKNDLSDFEDLVTHARGRRNHKIASVEVLNTREDVYDLTVEPWHNFALASGVFVHNSIDGDSPAAMRYTEARLAEISDEMVADIDKDTVEFVPNFDGSLQEPTILPARLPNLLINGSSGIAVGMATNIPPHNLGEIIDGIAMTIENPDVTVKQLMRAVQGPDFPTGGIICGMDGILEAYKTGRGLLKVRAKANIESQKSGKESIVVTELPYQANKAALLESIAALVNAKKIDGITDLRDESDKDGMRIVIELRRDANAQVVLNQLHKHTQLAATFGVIMLALVDGSPRVLNLKQLIEEYIDYRKEIVVRRTKFELARAQERAHILEGLKTALENLDKVIKTIRRSKSPADAKEALMKEFDLTAVQAQAILDMQLAKLTSLEREKLEEEYLGLIKKIELYKSILANERKVLDIIKEELSAIKKKYADERRTEIVAEATDFEIEDLIAEEDVVITISHAGYIKRQPVSAYRKQRRGGIGVTAVEMKEEDFVEHLFIASTHDYILFFTDKGKAYWLKVFEVPQAGRLAKGKAIVNLLQLQPQENIRAMVAVRKFEEGNYLVMATKRGLIKKTELTAYSRPRKGGIIGITIEKDDELIGVERTDGRREILLATKQGKAVRFSEAQVRDMGRSAKGVIGIRLSKKDEVVGMEIVREDQTILTIAQEGFGKRSQFDEYRKQSRGGKGIINIKVTKKNGEVVGIKAVSDKDEVIIITQAGMIVRTPIKGIRTIGRSTQGVRIISLREKDKVASIARVIPEE